MGHDIISKYNCTDFLNYFKQISLTIPCILCLTVHKVVIHEYFGRLVRSEYTEKNIEIIIFSIYCENAREMGKQYTKRILPYFVIPECNICMVNIFAFYKHCCSSGKIDYNIAGAMLGTVCVNTIKRHYNMMREYVKITNQLIIQYLSSIPNLYTLESRKPSGNGIIECLFELASGLKEAVLKSGSKITGNISLEKIIHRTYVLEKSRKPLEKPMNLEVCILFFHDTS